MAKFYKLLKLAIAREKTYLRLEDGIEISDTMYQSPEWEKPRRIIIVRHETNLRPKAIKKECGYLEKKKYIKITCTVVS